MCQDHWDRLKAKVEAAGLSALNSTTGEDAMARMTDQITTGDETIDNFDPLMGAHNSILANMIDQFGAAVILYDGCPLCAANEGHNKGCTDGTCTLGADPYDQWLDFAVRDQVEVWKALKP